MLNQKEKLQNRFEEEYEKLNAQQKVAVDTLEGPVMVIAGPGTGKTQILASRIGKILLETDTAPENILCLTYTDAGAVAMRKRLLHFIGTDAYKVNICTFHAFCNDVIQENLQLFEKNTLDAISELERVQLFKELIDTLPRNNPLKRYRGDVYYEIVPLQSLFSTMKREGWTPEFVLQRIQTYLDDIPYREEYIYKRNERNFRAGDLKRFRLEEEKLRMEKLKAAVNEFDRFQMLMRKYNRYDFDDMINWVIKAFEDNNNLLLQYQEKFQYILVDEFQDTSGTQNKLVSLLISYWDQPNIFVVGDDDQSIFRFQGANVQNMLDFANQYKDDLTTIILTKNYRSTQPILDVSKSLINRNKDRLIKQIPGLSKDLEAANTNINHLINFPCVLKYETQNQEMIGITKQVETLVGNGVSPGKIGIIYKENRYGETLSRYLKLLNIPIYTKKNINILEIPLAQKIMKVLQYVAAEHDVPSGGDEMLFEILHYDWFGIPPADIAMLSMEASSKRLLDGRYSIRMLIAEKIKNPPLDLFTKGIHQNIEKAWRVLENLIAEAPNTTLQILFERIIRTAGVLTVIMRSPDKHWQLQVLTALFDFIKNETHKNPFISLQQFVDLVDLMEGERISIPLVQVSGSDKGVNLMTAHGSKGLEFEHVFFVGCIASVWEKKRKPSGGYTLPDTMFDSASQHNDDEELRRLFYVATTRAEQYLTISYSTFKGDNKEQEPSIFIAEIQEEFPHMQTETMVISRSDESQFSALLLQEEPPQVEKIEKEIIKSILENFALSVTALNNYLKCPLEFYFRNLIRIPSPKNEAAEFGSAVHYALEQLFRNVQEKAAFKTSEEFVADFEWFMYRHRESFTKEQFNRRMEFGREILANYYVHNIHRFNKVVAIERNIRNVIVNNVPIKGKLDKLEFEGKLVNVVDYKTGDPDKAYRKLKGPDERAPEGGDYWRQAVFYKILVDHYEQKDWKVVSCEFDFIEPNKRGQFSKKKIVIPELAMDTVIEQITTVWEKIQAHDFYTGCGKDDCHWCNFVKTNAMSVEMETIEEEE